MAIDSHSRTGITSLQSKDAERTHGHAPAADDTWDAHQEDDATCPMHADAWDSWKSVRDLD